MSGVGPPELLKTESAFKTFARPTQRLILCDENTLCREMPEERIFEHLTLIVNCHETQAASRKRPGVASGGFYIGVACKRRKVGSWGPPKLRSEMGARVSDF